MDMRREEGGYEVKRMREKRMCEGRRKMNE